MYLNQPIKQWILEDRPREKMMKRGMNALTNAELLAILIGSGTKNETAITLAQRILENVNNELDNFARLNLEDLCKFNGIGEAKAIRLLATFELGRRRSQQINANFILNTSEKAYDFFKSYFADLQTEEFHIALFNQRNKWMKTVLISKGGINSTVVDIRLIFKAAMDIYATKIILIHNHPSGNLEPSMQDNLLTERIVSMGKMLEINVIDHLIITNNGYFSYADKNLLG